MAGQEEFYWADLHIHSALSPCADDTMTPRAIVEQAHKKGLSIIALTDHNSTLNCPAIMDSVNGGTGGSFLIIPGMELQTREEVHLVCLFGKLKEAMDWHYLVNTRIEPKANRIEYFGNQLIFDSEDHICGIENNLLLGSTDFSIEEVFNRIREYNGIAIPAHIDRPSYSALSNLGFLPPSLQVKVIEISHQYNEKDFRQKYPELAGINLIQSSDAHRLDEIGRGRSGFYLPELSWAALLKVLLQIS